MRHNLLQKPNVQRAYNSTDADVFKGGSGTVDLYRKSHASADTKASRSLADEEQYYRDIDKNLNTADQLNAKDAGSYSDTPQFQEALRADVVAHRPEEQMGSIDRQNALRRYMGMSNLEGGTPEGTNLVNMTAQSMLPQNTGDVRALPAPNNSGLNNVGVGSTAPATNQNAVTSGPGGTNNMRRGAIQNRLLGL
jgi:hypothetical protein